MLNFGIILLYIWCKCLDKKSTDFVVTLKQTPEVFSCQNSETVVKT